MNNEEARKRLELAVQLREASDRHLQASQELSDQASAINKEIEAHFAAEAARKEASEAVRRPASLDVMPKLPKRSLERLAAAVAEDRERVLAGDLCRRRPIADNPDLNLQMPEGPDARWSLRRLFGRLAVRSSESPVRIGT